ncbi:hypothetical protein [Actinomadura sp. BRA 177]|uniref:hypothetical protein n=1 Tax=Actinomadura sp. BRA 177 TaxID=2745202 RepID=UPI00159628E8|nr:hypothetical protein [Actinomadura sp. BRA 177]NVI91842.1 hypothetical protein [Actinomadura sp. BRA 177]
MTVDLYSWDVQSGETHAGACGVSGDRGRALEALAEALRDEPPGARGSVWLVHLKLGRNPEYDYEGLLATGVHGPQTGAVTVDAPT